MGRLEREDAHAVVEWMPDPSLCQSSTTRKGGKSPVMSRLASLNWLVILGPFFFFAAFTLVAHLLLPTFGPHPIATIIALIISAIGAFLLTRRVHHDLTSREREIEQCHQEIAALHQVSEAVNDSSDLPQSLSLALDAVLQFTHAAAGRVWIVDHDTGVLRNTVHRGLFPDAFAKPGVLKLNEVSPGQTASSRAPAHVIQIRPDNPEWHALHERGFIELVSVPLIAHGRVVGVLDLAARHRNELIPSTLTLLASIGQEIGLAIEKAHLFESIRARQLEAASLFTSGLELSSTLDLQDIMNLVTRHCRELLNADASALCLWDDQKQRLLVGSHQGPTASFRSDSPSRADSGQPHDSAFSYEDHQAGTLLTRQGAKPSGLVRIDAAGLGEGCSLCTLVGEEYRREHIQVPVRAGDQAIGCLCVSRGMEQRFSDGQTQILSSLASQAALAIRNAQRYSAAGNVAITVERERLAREMHDTLAQVLGFVSAKSQTLRELLVQGQIVTAEEQLDQLTALSQQLYADVREVILGLRTSSSPDKRLLPVLAEYVDAYGKQSGIETRLLVENNPSDLRFPPAVELQLIRIVQESLTNVRKHARAQHAIVRFTTADDHLVMQIEDDGRGFDPTRIARGEWPRFGLQSMRERAESVGGTFTVTSRPGVGARVQVKIPIGFREGR